MRRSTLESSERFSANRDTTERVVAAASPSSFTQRVRLALMALAMFFLGYSSPTLFLLSPSFMESTAVAPSMSMSATPSHTPSPTPSERPRAFRKLAFTGETSLPSCFSVAPGVPLPRTTHYCSGAWDPLYRQGNRSCEFQDLYLDVALSEAWTRTVWTYILHTSDLPLGVLRSNSTAVLAWAKALRAEVHVGLAASNREADQWFIEVVVYEEGDVNGIIDGDNCGALIAAPAPFKRTFLLQRCVPSNMGHQLWEEYYPWFSALEDLGHSGEQGEYGFLEKDPKEFPGQGFHPATEKCYDALTPLHKPLLVGHWLPSAQAPGAPSLMHFPVLAAGLMGRSPGGYPADFTPPGHERGTVWRFRNHYIANLGLAGEDVGDWGAVSYPNRSAAPFSLMLLQKPNKRRFQNIEEVRDAAAARWPEARVWVQTWESLNMNHREEVRLLINTSIFLSMSGTGANTAFLLPRGSVHINTGAPLNYLPGHVGENFISGNSHVRLLHYQGMSPEDADGPSQEASVRLPLEKIMPVLENAVRLWREGFTNPVPWPENLSPQGKLVTCLLHRYPYAQWWASHWQGTLTDAAKEINFNPREWFRNAANNLNAQPTVLLAKENIPTAQGYELPSDIDSVIAHCAKWAGAHTMDRLDRATVDAAPNTMPQWVAARAEQLLAADNAKDASAKT